MRQKIRKGFKHFIEEKVQVLSNAENRLVLGLIVLGAGIGIGGGLIVSAYIRV